MPYLVSLPIFIDSDGRTPQQAARCAEDELSGSISGRAWEVIDTDTGHVTVVDLALDRVIEVTKPW